MASSAAWSCRDRTSEFRSLSETLKRIGGFTGSSVNDSPDDPPTTTSQVTSALLRSDFNKKASRIGLGIHQTCQKISRLGQLAKKSSIFDDPMKEIQELTAYIKDDIRALNIAVSDLQTVQSTDIADGSCSEDRVGHASAVCDDLKNRLMGATKQFQDVLTSRTENMKAHENRKQIFSTNASTRGNPLREQIKPTTEPPPWSTSSGEMQPPASSSTGVQGGNQLRRRLAADTPPPHMEVSVLQQVVPRPDNYIQSRAVALQNVESTISELSGIFTHLATMVTQQGELAIRIDDNIEESLANVEGARSALIKHLKQISSNRWLLIKIFAVLILFLMIFVFFLA